MPPTAQRALSKVRTAAYSAAPIARLRPGYHDTTVRQRGRGTTSICPQANAPHQLRSMPARRQPGARRSTRSLRIRARLSRTRTGPVDVDFVSEETGIVIAPPRSAPPDEGSPNSTPHWPTPRRGRRSWTSPPRCTAASRTCTRRRGCRKGGPTSPEWSGPWWSAGASRRWSPSAHPALSRTHLPGVQNRECV